MSERRRVLHIISVLSVGGVEMWLISLLRHMRELSDKADVEEFDILMTGGEQNELDSLAQSLGANLHYIPFTRAKAPAFTAAFRALLRERRYTAVHDHQDYAAAWHFLAGSNLLPPIRIVHVHSSVTRLEASTNTMLRKAGFLAARRTLRRTATTLLGTSSRALAEYDFNPVRFPRQNIAVLHCGFDPRPFAANHREQNASVCAELGWPDGARIVLFVGRLDGLNPGDATWNNKNPHFAVDIAVEALSRDDQLKFVFVGAGDIVRAELEARVAGIGLSDSIKFVGRRLDVPRFMAASTCLLFPSLEEGLGMVAVEAQSAGLRVLASHVVPRECVVVPELVSFRQLNDGPAAWADELLAMSALPRFDSKRANEAVQESSFSIDKSYDALHRLYSGLSV